jgi:hypothetical protein
MLSCDGHQRNKIDIYENTLEGSFGNWLGVATHVAYSVKHISSSGQLYLALASRPAAACGKTDLEDLGKDLRSAELGKGSRISAHRCSIDLSSQTWGKTR